MLDPMGWFFMGFHVGKYTKSTYGSDSNYQPTRVIWMVAEDSKFDGIVEPPFSAGVTRNPAILN